MYLKCNISIHVESLTTAFDSNGFPIFLTDAKDILTFTEVEIKNDWSKLGTDCDIILPLTVKIFNKGQYLIDNPKNLFKSGDRITIKAWYDGYAQLTVFEGFIYDFVEGTPIKMRCLDYYYFLKLGLVGRQLTVNGQKVTGLQYPTGTIEQVISDILQGTGITLMDQHISFNVQGLSFVNVSPAYCLEWIKKELGITMNLFGNKLYFNLADVTNTTINLKSDTNVLKCEMQKPDGAFQKFKVQVNVKDQAGLKKMKEYFDKGNEDGEIHTYNLYCIPQNDKNFKSVVNNTLVSLKLGHYSGKITTLLYPNINLFDAINYQDVRFPDRSGLYVVRGIVLKLDQNGFHQENSVAYLREFQPIDAINPANSVYTA